MNLFEIMQSASGGEAFTKLAAQHGLSEADMRKAAEAFLPAFSAGLKRSTADPLALMTFMQQLALGPYAAVYRDPASALAARPGQYGDALSMMFGSSEAARAVAGQAAAYAGLAVEKMQELMAPLAAITLGGLATQARAANPMLDAMLKGFGLGPPEEKRATKGPLDRLEDDEEQREREKSAAAAFARMQEEMMRSGLAAFQAGAAGWQQAMSELAKRARPSTGNSAGEPRFDVSGRDLFGEAFESGLRVSEAYRREMEALLDRLASKKRP
jgi:hypothetical protein